MIEISQLQVYGMDLDFLEVSWEIPAYEGSLDQYEFWVLRSESEAGPYQSMAGPFKDRYHFRDTAPRVFHQWRQLFYKIRVRDTLSDEIQEFGPAAKTPPPSLQALEQARQKDIVYRAHQGRRCWVLPVRTFGARCGCYSKVSGQTTKSKCINCYSRGFLGGYLSPIEAWVQILPTGGPDGESVATTHQPLFTHAKLASRPRVKNNDIIVEQENIRWVVNQVDTLEINRFAVEQILTVSKIPEGDIAYKIPILADASLPAIEERNFTNPQCPDPGVSLADLFTLYGQPTS